MGRDAQRGRSYMPTSPFLVFFPGIAIALLVLGFDLLSDSLRDALDPWMQHLD
jgi:ABC-type dipeptide/oligopeptide/nickel transport system permease subunit